MGMVPDEDDSRDCDSTEDSNLAAVTDMTGIDNEQSHSGDIDDAYSELNESSQPRTMTTDISSMLEESAAGQQPGEDSPEVEQYFIWFLK